MDHQKTENEPVRYSNTGCYVVDSAHTYCRDFESEFVAEVRDAVFMGAAISVVYELNWVRKVSYRTNVMFLSRQAKDKGEITVPTDTGECYFVVFKKLY